VLDLLTAPPILSAFIPPILSAFIHLFNPVDFPPLHPHLSLLAMFGICLTLLMVFSSDLPIPKWIIVFIVE
jgi:hypothetical protein